MNFDTDYKYCRKCLCKCQTIKKKCPMCKYKLFFFKQQGQNLTATFVFVFCFLFCISCCLISYQVIAYTFFDFWNLFANRSVDFLLLKPVENILNIIYRLVDFFNDFILNMIYNWFLFLLSQNNIIMYVVAFVIFTSIPGEILGILLWINIFLFVIRQIFLV